jgi:hypothetical protein
LLAAGVDPGSLHRGGAPSPVQFLGALFASDGHVRYSHGSDQTPVWVTAQALMALDGKPLPLAPVALHHAAAARSAGPSVGASVPARAHGRAATHHHAAPARRRHARRAVKTAAAGSPAVNVYAAGAGLLTALALAPVGLG